MKRLALCLIVLFAASPSVAADVTYATGRNVTISDRIDRVLPSGPPAAVLLTTIAPRQMIGFSLPIAEPARAALAPAAAGLPQVPRLTAQPDATAAIQPLHADPIIDYGTVSPRYKQLTQETQQRTGVPALLFDAALDQIPQVARTLAKLLHQQAQAEAVAHFSETILALPLPADVHPRVLYARGADGLLAAAPDTGLTAVFSRLGWHVAAPDGTGTFRPTSLEAIRALDPDIIILSDPAMQDVLAHSDAWRRLRAVRDGKAYIAPSTPFGRIEEPPSINRLLVRAWLRGGDPVSLAGMFDTVVYGQILTRNQIL